MIINEDSLFVILSGGLWLKEQIHVIHDDEEEAEAHVAKLSEEAPNLQFRVQTLDDYLYDLKVAAAAAPDPFA